MMLLRKSAGKAQQRLQRGVAVIECIIVLPVVLFMMMAVAEFGYAMLQYNRLTIAVRDGARYMAEKASYGSTSTVVLEAEDLAAAANLVTYGMAAGGTTPVLAGLSPGAVTITVINGVDVSVTANYQYQPVFFSNVYGLVGTSGSAGPFTMSAQMIMRAL